MTSRRSKRVAAAKEETPVQQLQNTSKRIVLAPKQLIYSPEQVKEEKPRGQRVNGDDSNQNEMIPEEEEEEEDDEKSNSSVENKGLSEYELERLENIRQNQVFLSSINLFQVSEELKQTTKAKPSKRGLVRSAPVVVSDGPPRKSLRLQKKEAEVLTLPPPPSTDDQPMFSEKKPAGPLVMDAVNMEEGSRLPPELLELCSQQMKEEKQDLDLQTYSSALKTMTLTENRVAKVVTDRIFSVAVHPGSSSPLVAAGDKAGRVGLWNMEAEWGDDGVLLFHPHTRPVPCMAFSRTNPAHLLSLSYDGSLRCMDVHKSVFDDVYGVDNGLNTFDFLSHDCSTLLVGTWYGDVSIVDRRTPGNTHESLHYIDPKRLRCVNVHPVQNQYFVVSGSSTVSVYDCRSLKKKTSEPVSQLSGHSRSISSAYFSPHTGNRVVTTSLDDSIRIFDTSSLTTEVPLLKSIRRMTNTGRWISKLSAVWDPKRDDSFVLGSLRRPREVEVFHESGRRLHSFTDADHLGTVLSVCAFHPHRNVLVGGNSSGRLHVFSE